MRRAAVVVCLVLAAASVLAAGWGADAFSTGNAAAARTGCGPQAGCHGVPGMPSPLVVAMLDGVPEAYAPNEDYALTVAIGGAPPPGLPVAENQGGFALEVTVGSLLAVDPNAQAEGPLATHTEVGNDQRAWGLIWTAPPQGAGEAEFFLSVNAVNGNGLQDPGDQWATAEFASAEGAPAPPPPGQDGDNTTAPPPPAPQRTPGPGTPLLVGALLLLAAASARRR